MANMLNATLAQLFTTPVIWFVIFYPVQCNEIQYLYTYTTSLHWQQLIRSRPARSLQAWAETLATQSILPLQTYKGYNKLIVPFAAKNIY